MKNIKSELLLSVSIEGTEEYLKKIEEISMTMDKLNALIEQLNAMQLTIVLDNEQQTKENK